MMDTFNFKQHVIRDQWSVLFSCGDKYPSLQETIPLFL